MVKNCFVDVSLFNYPEGYEKPIDITDFAIKVKQAKANIVFLFKHIDEVFVKKVSNA